jgi:hypothetical protein
MEPAPLSHGRQKPNERIEDMPAVKFHKAWADRYSIVCAWQAAGVAAARIHEPILDRRDAVVSDG